MGRGIYEGSPRTERLQLETRNSDPSNPSNGEAWLRTDLTGTDKVAEYRWYDGASVNAVDVVTPGTTSSPVEEVLRVQTPNGKGVIKTAPRADATHPEQSLQHAGSPLGLGYSAIPDSAVALWDAQALSGYSDGDRINSWSDSAGSFDLSDGTGLDYAASAINGYPAAYSDGTDDNLGRNTWGTEYSQPFTVSGVFMLNGTISSNQAALSWEDTAAWGAAGLLYPENNNGNKAIYNGGSLVEGGSADTNMHAFVAVFDGANTVLNVDGTEYTGDAGDRIISSDGAFKIGDTFNTTAPSDCYHGEHLLHDQRLSSSERTDEINRLTDKWT